MEPAESLKQSHRDAIEKLVGKAPDHMVEERRRWFERLVLLNEQNGESLNAPPQVSKTPIDLYQLYKAVERYSGFEAVRYFHIWRV